MNVTREEALGMVKKWTEPPLPLCLEIWSIAECNFFCTFPLEELFLSEFPDRSSVTVLGPRESVLTLGIPVESDKSAFYFGLPSECLELPSYIRESRIAASLSETNTPALSLVFETCVVLIHEHPENVFFRDDEPGRMET